jgi:hypothetical protein
MTIFSLSVSFGPQFARCFPIMVRNYNLYDSFAVFIAFSIFSVCVHSDCILVCFFLYFGSCSHDRIFPKTIVFRVAFTEAVERSTTLIPAPLTVSLKFIAANGYGMSIPHNVNYKFK